MIEEYIKRKDALDVFSKHMFAGYRGNGKSFFSEIIMPTFYHAIEELPSEDVKENIYGKWIHLGGDEWACSECGNIIFTKGSWEKPYERDMFFCNKCGADMRGKN